MSLLFIMSPALGTVPDLVSASTVEPALIVEATRVAGPGDWSPVLRVGGTVLVSAGEVGSESVEPVTLESPLLWRSGNDLAVGVAVPRFQAEVQAVDAWLRVNCGSDPCRARILYERDRLTAERSCSAEAPEFCTAWLSLNSLSTACIDNDAEQCLQDVGEAVPPKVGCMLEDPTWCIEWALEENAPLELQQRWLSEPCVEGDVRACRALDTQVAYLSLAAKNPRALMEIAAVHTNSSMRAFLEATACDSGVIEACSFACEGGDSSACMIAYDATADRSSLRKACELGHLDGCLIALATPGDDYASLAARACELGDAATCNSIWMEADRAFRRGIAGDACSMGLTSFCRMAERNATGAARTAWASRACEQGEKGGCIRAVNRARPGTDPTVMEQVAHARMAGAGPQRALWMGLSLGVPSSVHIDAKIPVGSLGLGISVEGGGIPAFVPSFPDALFLGTSGVLHGRRTFTGPYLRLGGHVFRMLFDASESPTGKVLVRADAGSVCLGWRVRRRPSRSTSYELGVAALPGWPAYQRWLDRSVGTVPPIFPVVRVRMSWAPNLRQTEARDPAGASGGGKPKAMKEL